MDDKSFLKQFDIRPKDESDYYTFLGFLVSRKLAFAAVVTISVLCIMLLWTSRTNDSQSDSPYKTYRYNSIPLKFTTGRVEILAKSGYSAYIGDIDNGVVNGTGTLFNADGNVVYEGEFAANAYNGTGKYYYPNAQLAYEGEFKDNLYDGEGKLYRENGTLKYEGSFRQGYMEGAGKLHNAAQDVVYTGTFHRDRIVYQELIGKSTTQTAQMYTGAREVYKGETEYCVYMKDIDAIYYGADRSNTLEEDFKVSGLYVLKQDIYIGEICIGQISELPGALGTPIYEGNTLLEPKDEVALNKMCGLIDRDALYGKAKYKSEAVFDDVFELSNFEKDYLAYIYVYEKDGIVYTFFCRDRNAGFDFYMMEQ